MLRTTGPYEATELSRDPYRRLSVSLFSVDMDYVITWMRKKAKKYGCPIELRSHRYDGFGRLAERGCFFERFIFPDGSIVPPARGVHVAGLAPTANATLADIQRSARAEEGL